MAKIDGNVPKFTRSNTSGAVVFNDYRDNFVIWPGREAALREFVNQTYGGQRHKQTHTRSSNSEDALTWSCFDALKQLDDKSRANALANLWQLAFDKNQAPAKFIASEIAIGKKYGVRGEETEVDVSIEGEDTLVFIEAKLYSSMSPADPERGKPYDQIARKLRVGLKQAHRYGKEFYFIVLDVAPQQALRTLEPHASLASAKRIGPGGFRSKWKTSYWFTRYKGERGRRSPLRDILADISGVDTKTVARNMGWLTWSDVYKVVLRAVIRSR